MPPGPRLGDREAACDASRQPRHDRPIGALVTASADETRTLCARLLPSTRPTAAIHSMRLQSAWPGMTSTARCAVVCWPTSVPAGCRCMCCGWIRNCAGKASASACWRSGSRRAQRARNVMLDTFDWQAESFYLRQGYTVYGRLPDCPPVTSGSTCARRCRGRSRVGAGVACRSPASTPARACAVPARRASRPDASPPPVPAHAGHPATRHRCASWAASAGSSQQLGVIQRIGRALELPRHLPRLPHMHADAEAGQRHQDHGQPVLEPLRQHFRPPAGPPTPGRQAPARQWMRPRCDQCTTTALATSAAAAVAGSSVSPVAASNTASTAQTQPGGSARRW